MFTDRFGRKITYVRLSVTDRCNFRCVYCMPEGEIDWIAKKELLTFEEIETLASILAKNGVQRIRITGGEPLVRNDIATLVSKIKDAGIESVALTTNAFLLAKYAAALRDSGVDSLNISLDSLREDRFKTITRNGDLNRVLEGIDAAMEVGFDHVKLNAVVVRGFNDDELVDLVNFASEKNAIMRFIEFMPIGAGTVWGDGGCVPAAEIRRQLSEHFTVVPDDSRYGLGPAKYFLADGTPVGFISAVTECFCEGCNRIRISARGAMRACLADDHELSVRDAIRNNPDNPIAAIEAVIQRSLDAKKERHAFDLDGHAVTTTAMHAIGG